MVQLHQNQDLFLENKISVVVVVPENSKALEKYLDSNSLNMTFVPDPKHIIADKYQQQVKILKLGRMPAQIVLDKTLKPVYEHFAKSMSDIVDEVEIIKQI